MFDVSKRKTTTIFMCNLKKVDLKQSANLSGTKTNALKVAPVQP